MRWVAKLAAGGLERFPLERPVRQLLLRIDYENRRMLRGYLE